MPVKVKGIKDVWGTNRKEFVGECCSSKTYRMMKVREDHILCLLEVKVRTIQSLILCFWYSRSIRQWIITFYCRINFKQLINLLHYFSLTVTSFHHKGAQNFYGHSRSTVPTLLMTVNQVHTPMTGMNSTVIFYCFQTIITVGISMCWCMNAASTIAYYMLVVLAEAVAAEAVVVSRGSGGGGGGSSNGSSCVGSGGGICSGTSCSSSRSKYEWDISSEFLIQHMEENNSESDMMTKCLSSRLITLFILVCLFCFRVKIFSITVNNTVEGGADHCRECPVSSKEKGYVQKALKS